MCVYHYEDSKRAERWVWLLLLGTMLFSIGVSVPMFILTYPGDECLLFVSVRGEALIYGNPAGCNFIAYGHCHLILSAIVILGLIFCRPRKGILRRKQPKAVMNGSSGIGLGQSHYNIQSEDTMSQFGVSRFYSTKAIVVGTFAAIFALITALVTLSGYLITCNELHYETRRQVLGRTTLGSPIRNLNIECWSLFRDTDFHTRFHFDHYEYSGQWHGQYRGYKHGRVHDFKSDHDHLIDTALALELSLSSSWISAALWITITTLMILLKRRSVYLQKRELAESIEDAKIFANSRQLDPTQNIMMQPMNDQMSVTSNQSSSVLSQKPSVISAISSPATQQLMLSQQELLNQQMLQMQQLQMANQQRLHQSQPVLYPQQIHQVDGGQQRPMSQQMTPHVVQQPTTQPIPVIQQHLVASPQVAQVQQLVQQQQQQNGIQYVHMSNGMLMPVMTQQYQQVPVSAAATSQQHYIMPATNTTNSLPKTVSSSSSFNQHTYSSIAEHQKAKTGIADSKNAQRAQLAISQDAGLKCSQI